MRIAEQAQQMMRAEHLSLRTEKAYLHWMQELFRFERHRCGRWVHPETMGSEEINRFLTHLAVKRNVAASTQNQALSAVLYLFRNVLKREDITFNAVRAKTPKRLPVVLSADEVRRVLLQIPVGPTRLIAGLLYGAGLRLLEGCRIRVKDIDFERRQIMIRDGKGEKDRAVPLPMAVRDGLQRQLAGTRTQHQEDLASGAGWVWLPYALAEKYPEAGRSLEWQYLFPARRLSKDPRPDQLADGPRLSNQLRRHHLHESSVQKAVGAALKKTSISNACQLPHPASQLRHASAGSRSGHPYHSGIAGPRRCVYDHDLYPREYRGSHWRAQSVGCHGQYVLNGSAVVC